MNIFSSLKVQEEQKSIGKQQFFSHLKSSKAVETIANIHFSQEAIHTRLFITGFWRRYLFIQQQNSSDCGAACLAMISRSWGKRFSLNTFSTVKFNKYTQS
ncbi:MAG: hypothetical protein KME30_20060 [Iphinoe sp. HA4291-MV1]|jgi:ATP-binding cassette subfamily B protein|nr:hypothetical protein [Iphinoe sp. HA4291-MV1]